MAQKFLNVLENVINNFLVDTIVIKNVILETVVNVMKLSVNNVSVDKMSWIMLSVKNKLNVWIFVKRF